MFNRNRLNRTLPAAALLASLLLSLSARAESLASRVPADAVAFAQWQGGDALGKSYESSKLKKFLDVLNLPDLLSRKFQEETDKQAANPQKQADAKLLKDLLTTVMKSPTGAYVGPLDLANPQVPAPRIAVFSKVGAARAAELAQALTEAIERNRKENEHKQDKVSAAVAGDFLLLNIGAETDIAKRLTGPVQADNLADTKPYKDALVQVDAATVDPAAMLYIDGEAVLKLIDDGVAAGGRREAENWAKAEQVFHFQSIHQIIWAGNFEADGNWIDRAFVSLSAQRTGIASLLDLKPLPEESFKLIPKSVTFALVTRLDLARIYDDVRDAIINLNPQNGAAMFDGGARQFFAFTGVDLKKDIIDNLTDTWIVYATPDSAGSSLRSALLVSPVKDGPKIDTALSTVEATITAMSAQRNPDAPQFKTQPLPTPDDKVIAHVLALPQISPAWAVSGDRLYVGASLAAIQSAISGGDKRGTITDNPDFAALLKKLAASGAPEKIGAFSYVDLPKLVAEIYPMVSAGISAELAKHPDEKNPFVLPPLDKITPTLAPALSVTWTDKDGFHYKGISPLPMANALTIRSASFALIANRGKAKPAPAPTDDAIP